MSSAFARKLVSTTWFGVCSLSSCCSVSSGAAPCISTMNLRHSPDLIGTHFKTAPRQNPPKLQGYHNSAPPQALPTAAQLQRCINTVIIWSLRGSVE